MRFSGYCMSVPNTLWGSPNLPNAGSSVPDKAVPPAASARPEDRRILSIVKVKRVNFREIFNF